MNIGSCQLYHGNRSELPCGRKAVMCLYPSRTAVCAKDLAALIHEGYFGRKTA